MTRKVYYTDTPQRRRLKQEAILILRQTRGLIDHALLENMRQKITSQMKNLNPAGPALPEPEALGDKNDLAAVNDRFEKIDRQKNMATILKFIEMKADNKNLMKEMKAILQETRH